MGSFVRYRWFCWGECLGNGIWRWNRFGDDRVEQTDCLFQNSYRVVFTIQPFSWGESINWNPKLPVRSSTDGSAKWWYCGWSFAEGVVSVTASQHQQLTMDCIYSGFLVSRYNWLTWEFGGTVLLTSTDLDLTDGKPAIQIASTTESQSFLDVWSSLNNGVNSTYILADATISLPGQIVVEGKSLTGHCGLAAIRDIGDFLQGFGGTIGGEGSTCSQNDVQNEDLCSITVMSLWTYWYYFEWYL